MLLKKVRNFGYALTTLARIRFNLTIYCPNNFKFHAQCWRLNDRKQWLGHISSENIINSDSFHTKISFGTDEKKGNYLKSLRIF